MSTNTRNSRIEILRIVSMFLIIYFHATRNGYLSTTQTPIIYFSSVILGSWGLVGVDLFVIIGSWFMSEKEFDIRKIINIVFQTFTWVIGYIVLYTFCYLLRNGVPIKQTINELFRQLVVDLFQPLWMKYYWFITSYLFLILLSPLLNKLLKHLNKREAKLLLVIFSFVVIVGQYDTSIICDIANFCYIYFLVCYVKRYGKTFRKFNLIYVVIIATCIILVKACNYYFDNNKIFIIVMNNTIGMYGRHSINALITALLIFINTINKKPYYSTTINKLSSKTLGVYLFHENNFLNFPNTTSAILSILDKEHFMCEGVLFSIRSLLVAPVIFIIGFVCESIRYRVIQKPFMKLIERKCGSSFDKVNKFINNL